MVERFHIFNLRTYISALEPLIFKVEELAVEEQASCIFEQDAESSLDPGGESWNSASDGHFLLLDSLVLGSLAFFLLSGTKKIEKDWLK